MGVLDDAIREHLDLKRRRGADPAEIERAERDALGPVRREAPMSALGEAEPPAAVLADVGELPHDDVEFGVEGDDFAGEPADFGGDDLPEITADDPSEVTDADQGRLHLDGLAVADEPIISDDLDPPTGAPIAGMPPEPEAKPKRRHLFGRHRHDHDDEGFDERTELPVELPEDDPFAQDIGVDPEPAAPRTTGDGEAVGPAQPIQREEPADPPPALKITPGSELGNTVEYDVEEAFTEEDGTDEDILEETPDFLADTPDHDRMWFEQKPPPDFDFDN